MTRTKAFTKIIVIKKKGDHAMIKYSETFQKEYLKYKKDYVSTGLTIEQIMFFAFSAGWRTRSGKKKTTPKYKKRKLMYE